jgi:hypothetical protein
VDWINLAQDRDRWLILCKHGYELYGSIKGGEILDWLNELLTSQRRLCTVDLINRLVISQYIHET